MATKKKTKAPVKSTPSKSTPTATSSPVDEMLLAALARGGDTFETGRFLVTFKEGVGTEGVKSLGAQGMRVADSREFSKQSVNFAALGDADAVAFPEIGVALVGGEAAAERSMTAAAEVAAESPIESIDPEYFIFAENVFDALSAGYYQPSEAGSGDQLRSLARILDAIAAELYGGGPGAPVPRDTNEEAMVLGSTWGLNACRVPQSVRSGAGIKVAVLDTGFDLGHPDFGGRPVVSQTFVGQPVQDLHGHGTHCIGTATGPRAPAGTTPRYGIGHRASIFVGKVLSNSGGSVGGSVLAGMNWAIANRCQVISMSLSGPGGPHPAYTAAGQAALNNGCLMVAATGNQATNAGAPANSPTIMAVASLDSNLRRSSFSNFGKVDIAGPGRDVFSSWPRPTRYKIISGTSMATPHVAGCAALWAESSSALRGMALWNRLRSSARPLPGQLPFHVGAGLVQAP